MPRHDDAEQQDRICFLQKFLRLEAGVQWMRARKIDIARSAAFDHPGAQQLGKLDELFYDGGIAPGLLGDDERIFRPSK